MYIIVGLGNPTRQYEGTKHKCRILIPSIYLIDEYQIPSSGTGHKALFGKRHDRRSEGYRCKSR